MSKYNDASFIMPQAPYIKAGEIEVLKPVSGGNFTFSRASAATRVNSEGLIEEVLSNIPRLNYPLIDGVVQGCPSLLLEPQRTNLITYSEDLSGSNWLDSGILSTDKNSIISPDGTLNGSKVIESTGNTEHRKRQSFSVVANTQYTYTGYFKPLGNRNLCILTRNTGFSSGYKVVFDFESQSIYNQSAIGTGQLIDASIELQNNGWYKVSLTTIVDNTSTSAQIEIFIIKENSAITTYLGDGVSGLYIWGVQVEQGSYATSYIPTSGSSVTRVAETCNGAGDASTFNSSEGVLMAEISALDNSNTFRAISISDGTTSNRVSIDYNQSNQIRGILFIDGNITNRLITDTSTDIKQVNKIAFKYSNGNLSLWVNGIEIGTTNGSNTLTSNTLNTLNFDFGNGLDGDFYGSVKQIQYFDSALTDAELQALTKI